jgi:hypothetical protein
MWRYGKINLWIRPRFSLRTLLILTALAAVGCYWWIAPPTYVAERFAKAVNDKDYATAKSMVAVSQRQFSDLWFAVLAAYQQEVADDPTVEVAMMRRTMQDIYHRERRIEVRFFHNATSPGRRGAGPAPTVVSLVVHDDTIEFQSANSAPNMWIWP